jgi:prepilin-type N-terminal cleavage/methylation domain-containing protein
MIKNEKGFTMLESIVAMVLVAVVVGAVFSAVMAARRAIIVPSQREDIIYAVESVSSMLKASVSGVSGNGDGVGTVFGVSSPLSDGAHTLTNLSLSLGLTEDCTAKYTISNEFEIDSDVTSASYILKVTNIEIQCPVEQL